MDWRENSFRNPQQWDVKRPDETDEQYYRRTGKGFFLPAPDPNATVIQLPGGGLALHRRGPAVKPPDDIELGNPQLDFPRVDKYASALVNQGFELPTKEDPVNPSHYNGTEALEAMIEAFGKEATIQWCRMTAYKYLLRMGKKDAVEQEAKKALWYLRTAERLTKELHDNAGSSSPHSAAPGTPTGAV